jgi:hypothetical protein
MCPFGHMFIPLPHWQIFAGKSGNLNFTELYWLPFTCPAEAVIKMNLSQLG